MSQVSRPLQISRDWTGEEPAITNPLLIRENVPPLSPDSSRSSNFSETSGDRMPDHSLNIQFQLKVKGATHSRFSKELKLWEKTFEFLDTEYIDMLVFFKASNHLKGNADEVEMALNPARLWAVSRIILALICIRNKAVEFPQCELAITELETAYTAWDEFDNSLFVLIWEFFKQSNST